jgi:hypothetical protein
MICSHSVLWQRISEKGFEQGFPNDRLVRTFIVALLGKRNSVSLFENMQSPRSGELRWRSRPGKWDPPPGPVLKSDKREGCGENKIQEIAELQKAARSLRRQIARIERDIVKYTAANERIRRTLPPDLQKSYGTFLDLHELDREVSESLTSVEQVIVTISARIPQ